MYSRHRTEKWAIKTTIGWTHSRQGPDTIKVWRDSVTLEIALLSFNSCHRILRITLYVFSKHMAYCIWFRQVFISLLLFLAFHPPQSIYKAEGLWIAVSGHSLQVMHRVCDFHVWPQSTYKTAGLWLSMTVSSLPTKQHVCDSLFVLNLPTGQQWLSLYVCSPPTRQYVCVLLSLASLHIRQQLKSMRFVCGFLCLACIPWPIPHGRPTRS